MRAANPTLQSPNLEYLNINNVNKCNANTFEYTNQQFGKK